jgi:cell division septal protein FtsQ
MNNKYPNEKTKRFNTPAYKQRMNAARRYKRRQSTVPTEESVSRLKWLKWLPVGVAVLAVAYCIYLAPFLQVNTLIVQGADGTLQSQVQQAFDTFRSTYNHGLPEKDILFFSKGKFSQAVAGGGLVASVQSVQKKYWHTIDITLVQRVPAYLLQTPAATYVIANDGVVSASLALTDLVPQGLPVISDTSSDTFQTGNRAFSAQEISFLSGVNSGLQKSVNTTVQSYSIDSQSSSFVTILTAAGYKIIFDSTDDAMADLSHLATVYAQQGTNPHIAYVDLRFNPRVYVCDIGQACATTPTTLTPPTVPAATVTPTATAVPGASSPAPVPVTQQP